MTFVIVNTFLVSDHYGYSCGWCSLSQISNWKVQTFELKKDTMIIWLPLISINIPENSSKAEIYELVRLYKTKVPFACVQVARSVMTIYLILPLTNKGVNCKREGY